MSDWSELKRLAEAAAEIESWYEVRDFYAGGISEMELDIVRSSDRDFIIATSPAAILALIAENERLQGLACAVNSAMHEAGMPVGADPADLADVIHRLQVQVATLQSDPNSWQSGYDRGRADGTKTRLSELEQLRSEVEQLKSHRSDWQAKCLKRGFEYVMESDNHYVLADTPEMAVLLGELLGVEVRSKDNDSYGETVSELREQLESASASFHRAYELEKENEALRKDAERYRFVRELAWYVDQAAYVYEIGNSRSPWTSERAPVDADDIEMAIDAAMGKGGRADG